MNTLAKAWALLSKPHRRAAAVLLIIMLAGMLLETLGLGLVVPVLALMSQADLAERYPLLGRVIAWLGNPSREHLVLLSMLALVLVFAVKVAFLAFMVWHQMRFVFAVQADLSRRLVAGYLHQPYVFHLERNSSQMIRNAIGDTDVFIKMGLLASLTLLTEVLVVIGVSAVLLFVEPLGALVVIGIVGLAAGSFHRATHARILRWGKARQLHEGGRIQHLQQGLGGVKQVQLSGREAFFLEAYHAHNRASARAMQLQAATQQMPRFVLELLGVSGLAILTMIMLMQGKPLEALLPALGLFAAAAFRVIPSANRGLGAAQNLRYALPVINVLHNEVGTLTREAPAQKAAPLSFNNCITLRDVVFKYPSAEHPALRSVSLSIPKGASVGFVGASGMGKSTLVDVILGLLRPASGEVCVDDVNIQTNLRGWQDLIGYVPQSVFLIDDSLRRNIAFGLPDDAIDEQALSRAVRAAQLEEYVLGLPNGLDTLVGERGVRLSGGQIQRIGIARALYNDPPVLVLDEATSSLDVATETEVMAAVKNLHGHKTILIVAHRLSTVAHCDRLFRLEDGSVVVEAPRAAGESRQVSS